MALELILIISNKEKDRACLACKPRQNLMTSRENAHGKEEGGR
jgi:hypothetical protein